MNKPSHALAKDANGGAIQCFAPNSEYVAGRYYVAPATIHSPVADGSSQRITKGRQYHPI